MAERKGTCFSRLAPVKSFDPCAFACDERAPGEVCGLVLALACAHNDLNDLMYAVVLLEREKPEGPAITREWGGYAGIHCHLTRSLVGTVRECLRRIREDEDHLRHPFFAKVIEQLPEKRRADWQMIVATAVDPLSENALGQWLKTVREKVAFHYDRAAIYEGFCRRFIGCAEAQDKAYVSLGESMATSRFYFADAAIDRYLWATATAAAGTEVSGETTSLLVRLNSALREVVCGFIRARGYSFVEV